VAAIGWTYAHRKAAIYRLGITCLRLLMMKSEIQKFRDCKQIDWLEKNQKNQRTNKSTVIAARVDLLATSSALKLY